MSAGKNAHGVYEDREGIRLIDQRARIPLAEVRYADTADGWRAVGCFSFTTGNWWGSSSPIMDRDPPFPTKDEAVAHAASELADRLSTAPAHAVDASMEPQRKKILAWLSTLTMRQARRIPEQIEMFA